MKYMEELPEKDSLENLCRFLKFFEFFFKLEDNRRIF